MPETNGWTTEVRAHVFDAIKACEEKLMILVNERDRQYTQRSASQDKAVVDAMTAAKEAVAAALAAAALAVDKAEANAEKWRNNANEWRQAMDDRETRFMGKEEARLTVSAVSGRVDKLEGTRAEGIGQFAQVLFLVIIGLMSTAAVVVAIVR